MKLPKILMVANYYTQVGGISGLVKNLSAGLQQRGYLVDIHSVGGPYIQRLIKYASLASKVKNYDVIHCHGSSWLGFIPAFFGAIVGARYNKSLILTYHSAPSTTPFIQKSLMIQRSIHKYSLVTTPSEETAKVFRQYNIKTLAVPNILDLENWNYRDRTIFLPNIVWTRNVYYPELAIEAFQFVNNYFPESRLTMCGKIATEKRLFRYKDIPGLELRGFIPRNNLPPIINSADIYLNTMDNESFGYSVYEAMAMGLAIVSVPSSALFQWGGNDAITFSKEATSSALANSIINVIQEQQETKRKVVIGREIVKKFSWENLFPVWEQIYNSDINL